MMQSMSYSSIGIRQARRAALLLACAALFYVLATGQVSTAALTLITNSTTVEIANDVQWISFNKVGGKWKIKTLINNNGAWVSLFDAQQPLIQGPLFNLEPTAYTVVTNTATVKLVRFSGAATGNAWTLAVEARSDTSLVKFTLTCNFTANRTLTAPQPTVALWMNQTTATLHLNQGPASPTGTVYGTPYNFGFPAAYLWDANREAMIYFDYTPMSWFRWTGVAGAADLQVKAQSAGARTGLGLFPWHLNGTTLNAGPMVTTFYLYSGYSATQPSKFAVLDRMLQQFSSLHGSTAAIPNDVIGGGGQAYWETFTQHVLSDAMQAGKTYTVIPTAWTDAPLQLVPPTTQMLVHATRIQDSAEDVAAKWSLMTTNMHLTPWILYNNLVPTPNQVDAMRQKKDALPRFYNNNSKMIASGTQSPDRVFDKEIAWNNFYYYAMIPQIYEALAADDFNPAIAGRLLMGTEGLIQFAHNVSYVIPTYFDPFAKQPVPFVEDNGLGYLREPWTVGQYAYAMMKANEYSGDPNFVTEAFASIDNLMNGMSYTESNNYFTRSFNQPMDMPVMSVIGNAYGAVAAYKVYQSTGYTNFLGHARNFLNVMLEMSYWREDNSDAIAATLHRQGLFYCGAASRCATPWETTEAQMCLAWMLKHDISNPQTGLMLKLANLNRINSFNFYPATFTPAVRALNPDLRQDLGQYFPIEDFYGVENPGGSSGDNFGGTAFYHSGNAMWNWWMYEALCQLNDRSILPLNLSTLDTYREAQESAQRDFIIYNPNTDARTFTLFMRHLAAASGNYTITLTDLAGTTVSGFPASYTATQLGNGIVMPALAAQGAWRLTLKHPEATVRLAALAQQRDARNRLSVTYQKLQLKARDHGVASCGNLPADFTTAWNSYKSGQYATAISQAQAILAAL